MHTVRSLLLLLVLLAITLTLLLTGAAGLGALLHRLIPAVELGSGVLIGVVALSVCMHFVLGLLGQAHSLREELDDAQIEEIEELQELVTALQHRRPRLRKQRPGR
jgi:hypothetical protein